MKETLEFLRSAIEAVEADLGLDWRFSFSRLRAGDPGRLTVELSRADVLQRLEAVLDAREYVLESRRQGQPVLRSPSGISVRLVLLGGRDEGALIWFVSSVANLRKAPEHAAELISQAIMGETAHELLREGDWYLVRLQDDYQGWVRSWSVSESDEYEVQSFMHRAGVRVESNIAYVRSQPASESLPVAEVVAGTALIAERAKGGFRRVHLPGGRTGFIQEEHLGEPPDGPPDGERIAARAKRFLGIPYLWGGTSPKGFDCSGFIKRVFGLEGIALPRDSDLQARVGTQIPRNEALLKGPGDLVFFGEGRTINHVAITLGGGYFIHAYGEVRVNSLNEGDTLFEGKLARSLLFGRSVLE